MAVLLRIAWRSVSGIVGRVVTERAGATDRLAGLRRIGIDEISYRKGQRYLLVVTCHDTGRLVWAGKDRTKQTLDRFFDDLGAERAAALTHVSADGAEFIHTVIAARAPHAMLCLDAFHVVAWATKALDEVRRGLAAELRRGGRTEEASTIKNTRWALLKNPRSLSTAQRTTLAGIQATNGPLRLPAQGATAGDLSDPRPRRRQTPADRLAGLGTAVSSPSVRQARPHDQEVPGVDPQRRRARPVQRPFRGHQRPPAAAHPPLLRPEPRVPHGHGRPHPRRALPTPPRPHSRMITTHRNVRRADCKLIAIRCTISRAEVRKSGSP
ncbi:MAG: transposase [Micromonosporaceae bacterium]